MGNEARNKVLVLHRRAGKTALAINKLIIEACKPENKGRTFWYIAPTYTQGKEVVWADPRMLFAFLPPELITKRNESELWVKTFNDTRIVVKGGEEPDSLLGADPYGVVIDETQSQKPELYERIIRPILAANGGWVWFLGTPRFKDHFHKQFIYASQTPGWQSYDLDAEVSGIIPKDELEEIRKNTPEDVYNQEYRARFLDGQGVVFRNIKEICKGSMEVQPKKGHTYSIGVDLARKTDFTVITVYDQSTDSVPYIERFNNVDWGYQQAKIEAVSRKWGKDTRPALIKVDSTGVGDPIYQALAHSGLPVRPVVFTNTLKEDLVRALQIRFDHRTIVLPAFQPLVNELEVFQEETLPSGKSRFAAPPGLDFHDDTVFSLALAIYQAPHIEAKDELSQKTLLMNKYRLKEQKRYSPKHKGLYNLMDMS